VRESKLK
jgi:hypothetical protein